MSRKSYVEIESLPEVIINDIPYTTKRCEILAYNRSTKTVGFALGDITVQTVLDTELPPNAQFITVKYRKNESGNYEFIF
jgi:hypothetical protein